jgi:hypothetical protein
MLEAIRKAVKLMHGRNKALCGSEKGEISLWHVIPFVDEVCVDEFDGRVEAMVVNPEGGNIFSHFVSIGSESLELQTPLWMLN